jgi:hypothetical protein
MEKLAKVLGKNFSPPPLAMILRCKKIPDHGSIGRVKDLTPMYCTPELFDIIILSFLRVPKQGY